MSNRAHRVLQEVPRWGPLATSGFLYITMAAFWPAAVCAAGNSNPVTVITIGDSLLTGHGLPTSSRFPALLERRLKDLGYDATIVDPGFLYTSKAALDWLEHPFTTEGTVDLSAPNTVAIVEIGSNDCPDSLPLDETRANLDQILRRLSAAKIPVLVVGAGAFEFCGADYVVALQQVFSDVATTYGELLYPDFTTGVLGHPELLQKDQNHPNEAGEVVVLNNMLPMVMQLISRLQTAK